MKPVVVLDTNVIISAVIFGGISREVLLNCIRGYAQLVVWDRILRELQDVLLRPKFGYTVSSVHLIVEELISISTLVRPRRAVHVIHEDPDDNRILESAVTGGAQYIITGDIHLLRLRKYRNIEILKPADFLSRLN